MDGFFEPAADNAEAGLAYLSCMFPVLVHWIKRQAVLAAV
jgi:hypothetical protein